MNNTDWQRAADALAPIVRQYVKDVEEGAKLFGYDGILPKLEKERAALELYDQLSNHETTPHRNQNETQQS